MPTMPAHPDRKALAFAGMLFGNACLAVGPWLVRMAGEGGGVGPIAAGFWRLALAAPFLVVLARLAPGERTRIARGLWPVLAVAGLFFALDLAAWHAGIMRTKLANSTLFGNAASFLFVGYGFLVARAWPGRVQALALALALAGIALLLGRSYELSARNFGGDLLCLLAGLFYAVYLVAIDRARATLTPLPTLAAATVAGLLPMLALALFTEGRIWPSHWGALIALALGSQVIGQGLITFAIGELSTLVVGLGFLTQPVVSGLIGWIVYGEAMTPLDLTGAGMIALALLLVRRPEPPLPLPADEEGLSSGP